MKMKKKKKRKIIDDVLQIRASGRIGDDVGRKGGAADRHGTRLRRSHTSHGRTSQVTSRVYSIRSAVRLSGCPSSRNDLSNYRNKDGDANDDDHS